MIVSELIEALQKLEPTAAVVVRFTANNSADEDYLTIVECLPFSEDPGWLPEDGTEDEVLDDCGQKIYPTTAVIDIS